MAAAGALVVATWAPDAGAGAKRGDRVPRAAKAVRVAMKGFSFRPRKVTVRRGAKVVFTNRDSARHNAVRRGSFKTPILRRGRSAAVRFKRRGVYGYICTLHPFMRGKVVVR
jgi:plastocyanin